MHYVDRIFDEERALYAASGAHLVRCVFDGPADGESALKESTDLTVSACDFRLRYPLWHVSKTTISDSRMSETCRAALWYCDGIDISDSSLGGIKALRECSDVSIRRTDIRSSEFGWLCRNTWLEDCSLSSEYAFLFSRGLDIQGLQMQGKYSFQYVKDVTIRGSQLKTKDAFWHSTNVTVYDSVLDGEYLGWYSENLRLVRCTIRGTQPLCYAKGLVLEDCIMVGCDLSFEDSEVTATVTGSIDSVKNPRSGSVVADSIGEVINGGTGPGSCEVLSRSETRKVGVTTSRVAGDAWAGDLALASGLRRS